MRGTKCLALFYGNPQNGARNVYDKHENEKSARIFRVAEKIFINRVATEAYGGTIFAMKVGTRAKRSFLQ
jgi:hypothetical protein